jgi:oxidase EvaA
MMSKRNVSIEKAFLESTFSREGVNSLKDFEEWFNNRRKMCRFEVYPKSLLTLDGWYFTENTGNLVHRSGKFFSIEGIDVQTNFGINNRWMQPIINQPEIGILGFLTKKICGIYHFLIQAKIEPGNVNGLQVSPTVQATYSNFTKVHGGKQVPYLDWFLGHKQARYLINQLQSEQGSRFLSKRNRNVIVEVREDEPIDVLDDFYWLTLGQLFELLKLNNMVNMDSRTVLSCIRYFDAYECLRDIDVICSSAEFEEDVYVSSIVDDHYALHSFDSLISWLTQMKTIYSLLARRVPLNQVQDWYFDGEAIRHRTGKYFSVVGVSVNIDNREVAHWDQPLIESAKGGILCFICQKRNNILHFLIQGRVEPGNFDSLEMAPTLQCTPSNYDHNKPESLPPFYHLVMDASLEQIKYDTLQSEEGGRFYHDQNRYIIVELEEDQKLDLPDNYIWMTIRQMKEFIHFNNYFNIEARGLLSCLSLKVPKMIGVS